MPSLETVTDAPRWETWLESQNAHLLQTCAWGEFKTRFGWRAERLWWRNGEKIHAGVQILFRPLAPGLTLGYVARGPVFPDADTVAPLLDLLKEYARRRGVFLLKVEPDWQLGDERDDLLPRAGAARTTETIQPPATIHIDLTSDLDTILARMKSKWRYNIRLSAKKGITVRAGTRADLPAFYNLMRATGERDRFAIHSAEYYRAAFEILDAKDMVRLFIAEYEQTPLGMIFVTAFAREAIYLYGASSSAERSRMPNHALHWAAIQWAKARGCAHYDLWGVPETTPETNGDSDLPSSLFQFKQGFGGTIVRYSGAWDFVLNPALYRVYRLARRVRKSGIT